LREQQTYNVNGEWARVKGFLPLAKELYLQNSLFTIDYSPFTIDHSPTLYGALP
jgi:hypothetical protein